MKNATILRVAMPLAVVAMLAGTVQAALTIYQPFDYGTATALKDSAGGTESGVSGVWRTQYLNGAMDLSADGVSLTYPDGSQQQLTPVGGRVTQTAKTSSGANLCRALTATRDMAADNKTFYMSALLEYKDRYNFARMQISLAPDTSVDQSLTFGFRYETDYTTPKFYLRGPGGDGVYGDFVGTDITYLLVVKVVTVTSGSDMTYMNIYETGEDTVGIEPVAWDLTTAGAASDSLLDELIIYSKQIVADVDEIRVGDSWEDVTGVPEPATMVLLGLGGLGVLLRRRRK